MMEDKLDDLYGYVQERCLWQFFSRSWDRQENIDGVLGQAEAILAGNPPARETPMEKLFYVDAKVMVDDFRARFPWIRESPPDEIKQLMDGLKSRLVETVITKSTNRELNHHLY
jgi:nitrogenase delta subunit